MKKEFEEPLFISNVCSDLDGMNQSNGITKLWRKQEAKQLQTILRRMATNSEQNVNCSYS